MEQVINTPPKYHKDGPFIEPVVRCDSCQVLIEVKHLLKAGMCPKCSNTRVRNVRTMSAAEMAEMKDRGVDPEWIALFEEMKLEEMN